MKILELKSPYDPVRAEVSSIEKLDSALFTALCTIGQYSQPEYPFPGPEVKRTWWVRAGD